MTDQKAQARLSRVASSGEAVLAVHLGLCLLFALLWHWESPSSVPDWFMVAKMTIFLAIIFQVFPWWCFRLAKLVGTRPDECSRSIDRGAG